MTDLAAQPAWYLELNRRPEETERATAPGTSSSTGETVSIADPAAYTQAALDRIIEDFTAAPEGTRNPELNRAAFAAGRLIAGGLPLTAIHVIERLEAACQANGLAGDDGLRACRNTIRSGIQGGARNPLHWTQQTRPAPTTGGVFGAAPTAATPPNPDSEPERTSWWPRSVTDIADDTPEPQPTLLRRTDGTALAYAGKINALIGESESGKTWVALEAIRQILTETDGVAAMLDFEDTYTGVRARLADLGLTDHHLTRFYYSNPAETLTQQARDDLTDFLHGHNPALVVVDGVNAAMTLLGMDLQDNKDATRFSRELLRPLTADGAGVITVDHVTKSREGRGNYAIGAQAKRADISGAALSVEVTAPFGRGMTGRLKINVAKDRPGHVRAVAAAAKHAAEAVITSTTKGVTVRLYAVGLDDIDPVMEVMEVLSQFIEDTAETPSNYKDLAKAVARREDAVRKAEQKLDNAGHIERIDGQWRHIRPYRRHAVDDNNPFDDHSGSAPNHSGSDRAEALPHSHPFSGSGSARSDSSETGHDSEES